MAAAVGNNAIGAIVVMGGDNAAEDSRIRFDANVGTGFNISLDDNAGDAVVQFNDADGGSFGGHDSSGECDGCWGDGTGGNGCDSECGSGCVDVWGRDRGDINGSGIG